MKNNQAKVIITKKKIKNLYLKIKDKNTIHISMPNGMSMTKVEKFLKEKESWISKSLLKVNERIVLNDEFNKDDYNYAFEVFSSLIDKYLKIYNEDKVKLNIKNMYSRWGSCNAQRRVVNLNIKLIKLDYELIEYVVVHELAHLKYQDHSKNFYKTIENVLKDHKARENRLKQYSLR